MNFSRYFHSDKNILYGKDVIKGTRIPVDLILEKLSIGSSSEDLLAAYPNLTREQIMACIEFGKSKR